MKGKKRTIASMTMMRLGISISIIVVLSTLISYLVLTDQLIDRHYTALVNSVSERISNEKTLFLEVEGYLQDLNLQISNDSSFQKKDIEAEFDALFELREDGSYRLKKHLFVKETNCGAFIDDSTELTLEIKERIIRYYHYENIFGRALNTKFTNLYIMGAENYIFNFWPEIPWCEQVTTDYRIWDEIYYYIATPEYNPEKQPVWTPVYYDEVADQRMTSCIVPIYLDGEHISSSGMDILLADLINRANNEILPGTSNAILSKEGDIIVHPDYNKKISESKSILKVDESNDPILQIIFSEIQKLGPDSSVTLLADIDIPYAVAYGMIQGPEWYYITLYKKNEIWAGVTKAVQIVFFTALIFLFIELSIVFFILKKNITSPLRQLIYPIQSMIRGDFTKSIAESNIGEIEDIRLAFNKMQNTISNQITSLKESKKVVEKEVEERKKVEKERSIAFNQISNIMNSSNLVSIIATNTLGIITHFNTGAQRLLGYSDKEIIGSTPPAIFHLDEEVNQRSDLIFEKYGDRVSGFDVFVYEAKLGKHTALEWTYVRKDGSQFPVKLLISAIRDISGNIQGFLGIGVDITDQKMAEKELRDYKDKLEILVLKRTNELQAVNEELRAINEEVYYKNIELQNTMEHLTKTQSQLVQSEKMASLGILTAGVAHEINNPLNYIMGAYQGLLQHFNNNSFSENPEQVEKLITALKTGVDRSSAIVRGLNQFSRKSNSLDEECNLHTIIDNSLIMLNNKIKYHIIIEKNYCEGEIIIKGNVGNLHQVFINIIGNAVHSIFENGKIQIDTKKIEDKAHIIIKDTGAGISKENIEKITDPFFTTKDPGKGTGLGLSITYNIIKEHNGRLEFESEEGKGTTVKIVLPKT